MVTAVFEYISMLQKVGPRIDIYDEIKKVEDIDFRFQEPVSYCFLASYYHIAIL